MDFEFQIRACKLSQITTTAITTIAISFRTPFEIDLLANYVIPLFDISFNLLIIEV